MTLKYCMSKVYDFTTVIISIADVATDVIVLLSFYYLGRTNFFIVSLVILCIAQCAYAAAFMWRYDVIGNLYDRCDSLVIAIGFYFILLPIGPIIPIIIFLTDEYQCFKDIFDKITGFSPENDISSWGKNRSAKWLIQKLNKHIGFIIEAGVEAFPQSLLQICAIVYYKEANYVSIVSILLSMVSVMTKSLVFSKGIEMRTFIWTWFCVVVDFFGIFFTLSWVFYSNDTLLVGDFLGYFSFIGEIWMYKILISVAPCVILILLYWSLYYLWSLIFELNDNNCCYVVAIGCFFSICVTAAVVLLLAVWFIVLEVFCFTFVAYTVYMYSTKRWTSFESSRVSDRIQFMVSFIGNASNQYGPNDRIIRILAINVAIYDNVSGEDRTSPPTQFTTYINCLESNQGIKGLQSITYSDLRNYGAHNKELANVFPLMIGKVKSIYSDCDPMRIIGGFILFPIFVVAKIFQILFPYFIICYLYYENNGDHELWNKIDTFQMMMLFAYIGLQFVLFVLGIITLRVNYWLWHIGVGQRRVNVTNGYNMKHVVNKWYKQVQWYPQVEKLIMQNFGTDIAQMILNYVHNIQLQEA